MRKEVLVPNYGRIKHIFGAIVLFLFGGAYVSFPYWMPLPWLAYTFAGVGVLYMIFSYLFFLAYCRHKNRLETSEEGIALTTGLFRCYIPWNNIKSIGLMEKGKWYSKYYVGLWAGLIWRERRIESMHKIYCKLVLNDVYEVYFDNNFLRLIYRATQGVRLNNATTEKGLVFRMRDYPDQTELAEKLHGRWAVAPERYRELRVECQAGSQVGEG